MADPQSVCVGDCGGEGDVTVNEIVSGLQVSLGTAPIDACPRFDLDRDEAVTVDEIVRGVSHALGGCPRTGSNLACPHGDTMCNLAPEAGLANPAFGKGAAFVDVDDDGWDDIWASDSDARSGPDYGISTLYRNQGDGTFRPFDLGINPEDLYLNWAASFADYDNDGDQDVLLMNGGYGGDSSLVIYRNDLSDHGRFTRASEDTRLDAGIETWWGAMWADYDLDGWLDFAVTPVEGRAVLYHSLGDGTFERVPILPNPDSEPTREDMKNPVWFDYDVDGYPDLYVAGPAPSLYHNEGDGTFTDVSKMANLGDLRAVPYVFAAAAEDFNQDGFPDLYLGRFMLQDLILLNDGGAGFTVHDRDAGIDKVVGTPQSPLGYDDPNWAENTMGLGVGDFDEDGRPDVFLGTGNPYRKYLDLIYCNTGTAGGALAFERCSDPIVRGHGEKQTHGIVLGDADRDGDVDVFFNIGGMRVFRGIQPPESRDPHAFYVRERRAERRTATVHLEGTRSNRDAIGARIRVEGSEVHHYTVKSSQGFQSQNSAWTVVALGTQEKATVTVQWPNGGECDARLWSGDRVVLREPADLPGARSAPSGSLLPRLRRAARPLLPYDGPPIAVDFLRCEGH